MKDFIFKLQLWVGSIIAFASAYPLLIAFAFVIVFALVFGLSFCGKSKDAPININAIDAQGDLNEANQTNSLGNYLNGIDGTVNNANRRESVNTNFNRKSGKLNRNDFNEVLK